MLPPASFDDRRHYRTALRLAGSVVPVTLRERNGELVASTPHALTNERARLLGAAVRRMFRLDDDLSPFYALVATDPALRWAVAGSGRMLASPTVFEDVIKTICTTNCAWSATIRMVRALVERGEGAFPEPERLAATPPRWFASVARMGYRGPYVRTIARRVASGKLDLERLLPGHGMDDEDVRKALLALPGIGPYAAAHTMQLLGRHRPLVLDSATRPAYLALMKKRRASDASIERAFRRYGAYAGLAFWLSLTRRWTAS